jgi:hypothetical protein
MLLFMGGAARTGKGILVRRLLAEMQMPYLSLDVLKMGLARGVPEYDIDPDAGGIAVGERLWPLVREMSASLLRDDVDYAIEGELLPKHVSTLQQAYPSQVKACFLGYTTITPAQKLHNIRTHAGYPNDWSSDYSDAELLNVIASMITFSQYLRDECSIYNLRYFDTSHDFAQTLDQVVAFIRAG